MTLMKLYTLWSFCMAVVSVPWVEASVLTDIGGKVQTGVLGDINTVAHPIDSLVLTTATSNCELVKTFFQISYKQLKDKREPDLNKLEIFFVTKEGQTVYNINEAANEIPKNPNFDPSNKVIFFLHGFHPSNISITTVTNALLAKGGYNVFALDASKLIGWFYLRSTTYVIFIGEKLGEILAALSNEGVEADTISIVGHSLGAHIGSYASKEYSSLRNEFIGRLTGLDPAGPCFENLKDDLRLKKTDAKFVDVVHTDAGVYGTSDFLGQVDYCPNGGYNQPDCLLQTCSHSRAWELYASSVTHPELFPAVKCKSWDDFKRNKCNDSDISYMGFGSTPESFGVYFLVTGGKFPYGLGEEGEKYTGGNGVLSQLDFKLVD